MVRESQKQSGGGRLKHWFNEGFGKTASERTFHIINNTLILLGAIPAAILAVAIGALIDLLQKKVTPRGLRKEVGR